MLQTIFNNIFNNKYFVFSGVTGGNKIQMEKNVITKEINPIDNKFNINRYNMWIKE